MLPRSPPPRPADPGSAGGDGEGEGSPTTRPPAKGGGGGGTFSRMVTLQSSNAEDTVKQSQSVYLPVRLCIYIHLII